MSFEWMNAKKPRGDSVLKTLPDERQREIIEHLKGHKLPETAAWLREDGIATSQTALSNFWSWWQLQERLRQNEVTTETLLEELKREVPGISEEQLDEVGVKTFSLLSIQEKDLDGFVRVRSARSKAELEKAKLALRERSEARLQEALGLQREKFRRDTCELFLKWAEDKRAKEIAKGSGSNSEKIERLGQLMFGEDWEGENHRGTEAQRGH